MPSITAQDFEAGNGGTLTATHSIDLEANFSDGSGRDDFQASAPPGVRVFPQGPNGVRVISDAPGALPITLTWTEHPLDADDCTASTSTTLQLQAPAPLRFGKLPRGLRPKALKFHGTAPCRQTWISLVARLFRSKMSGPYTTSVCGRISSRCTRAFGPTRGAVSCAQE